MARNWGRWTEEEDKLIISLHQEFGGDWEKIKKRLPMRPNCKAYFRDKYPDLYISREIPYYPWASNEDRVLAALERKCIPLREFPSYFPDRNYDCCRNRRRKPQKSEHLIPQRPWSEQEEQRLVELRKANKSWLEIWKALDGAHTQVNCRIHWFDKFWDDFNNSIVNGEIDLEKLKEGVKKRSKASEANGGEPDVGDEEVDADGDTDYEEEYGDADADGDTDYEGMEADGAINYEEEDGEADADGDTDYEEVI